MRRTARLPRDSILRLAIWEVVAIVGLLLAATASASTISVQPTWLGHDPRLVDQTPVEGKSWNVLLMLTNLGTTQLSVNGTELWFDSDPLPGHANPVTALLALPILVGPDQTIAISFRVEIPVGLAGKSFNAAAAVATTDRDSSGNWGNASEITFGPWPFTIAAVPAETPAANALGVPDGYAIVLAVAAVAIVSTAFLCWRRWH